MAGLLLLGVYVVIAALGEAAAIGIGLIMDQINETASVIVFFLCSAVFLAIGWPLAVRVSKPFAQPAA